MGHHNVQTSQDMNLVLSTDAKPRLKWTPELHQRFVDAVNQLGGAEKATPKSLMRMMAIPGLTLYHLKSHLQKYRLGKNQQPEICKETIKQETKECKESCSLNELSLFCEGNEVIDSTEDQMKQNGHISEAIHMQMEVQRKLHEQIEVQRHLQLRIEAQGKYLQKVLKKAQETLTGYSSTAASVEHAKAEISQLVSLVTSSSFSDITETTDLSLDYYADQKHTVRHTGCSVESSLTSSECSDRRDEERNSDKFIKPETLQLLDKPESRNSCSRKRSRSTVCESIVEQTGGTIRSKQACKEENMGPGLRKLALLETFDLNAKCELIGLDLGPNLQPVDLNAKE